MQGSFTIVVVAVDVGVRKSIRQTIAKAARTVIVAVTEAKAVCLIVCFLEFVCFMLRKQLCVRVLLHTVEWGRLIQLCKRR